MLRCAECGGLVSEWAAHCPECGHSADDATDITAKPASKPRHEAERDPYADLPVEEREAPKPVVAAPPPRKHRRIVRAAIPAVVLVAAAAGLTVGLSASTGGHQAPQGLRTLFGDVVADGGHGTAVSYDPETGRTSGFQVAGGTPFTPVAVSPDGTTWLGSDGTIFTVAGSRVTTKSTHIAAAIAAMPTITPATPSPFAEGDQAVVLLSRPTYSSLAEATVVSVADGRQLPIGLVDQAGGDPQTLGAFVSVPVGTRQVDTRVADRDVELRRPGQAPVVLATASQLNQDVGWLATRPVQLGVYPSPTGDAVAVVLTPLDSLDGDTPMVVLDRNGGVLAEIDDWSGPMYGSSPVWSPGGHQLAYPTYTTSGPALVIGSETGDIGAVAAPPGTTFGSCIWSLSSTDVVCQTRTGNRSEWLYALPTTTRLLSTPSAGTPVGWTPGPLP